MKKFIFLTVIILIIILVYSNNKVDAEVVIPDGAIRVRVISNSNAIYDQSMKMLVKSYIEDNLSILLIDVDSIEEARDIIENNMDKLNDDIDKIFLDNDYNMDFSISFGNNYFPDKEYKGVIYNEGIYESLVVTIGKGQGDNWWCVLFPPLCLLDASDNDSDEVTYKSFVVSMLDRIF